MRAPRIKKEAVETRIRTEEARRVPGTQGDTLKVVQNLPGVARSAFGSGQLIVWGSAPKETRVNVDGVEIPALYHVGGLRSTVNSDLVRSIDLSPGSYGAEYGRGLGGLVRIDLRPLAEGTHGYVAADVIDTSAPWSRRRSRPACAWRSRAASATSTASCRASPRHDVGDFVPIPRYDDYQARAQLALRHDEELAATFLASDDHLRRTIPGRRSRRAKRTQNSDSSYKRLFVRYARLLDDGSSFVVTPSFGYDTSRRTSSSARSRRPSHRRLRRHLALRAAQRLPPQARRRTTLSMGVDMQARRYSAHRTGSANLPAREGDIVVFGQPPVERRQRRHLERHARRHGALRDGRDRRGAPHAPAGPALRADPHRGRSARLPRRRPQGAARLRALRPCRPTRSASRRCAGRPTRAWSRSFRATKRLTFTRAAASTASRPTSRT